MNSIKNIKNWNVICHVKLFPDITFQERFINKYLEMDTYVQKKIYHDKKKLYKQMKFKQISLNHIDKWIHVHLYVDNKQTNKQTNNNLISYMHQYIFLTGL